MPMKNNIQHMLQSFKIINNSKNFPFCYMNASGIPGAAMYFYQVMLRVPFMSLCQFLIKWGRGKLTSLFDLKEKKVSIL